MVDAAHAVDHRLFVFVEIEFGLDVAVQTFTSLTADGDNGCIGLLAGSLHAAPADFYLRELGLSLVEEPHLRILVGLEL